MKALTIPQDLFEAMIVRAQDQAPLEACGLLAGVDDQVRRHFPMTNVDAAEDHFSLDPSEQFAAAKAMRTAGLELLAVWHSHPASPARPSDEDIRLAFMPEVATVIVSLESAVPVVKGFRICEGRVTERPIEISREFAGDAP